MGWLRNGVGVTKFAVPYKGSFRGKHYNCYFPPPTILQNLQNCEGFKEFISSTILERLYSGAIKGFLNLWMKDCPFSLDKLTDVKGYVYQNSFMTKCDDKSGYDHLLLSESSQQFFGFEWAGWWFVSRTLPFGWKESAFIYQTLGVAVSSFFLRFGNSVLNLHR